jgi:thiol:disulfide interchange protein
MNIAFVLTGLALLLQPAVPPAPKLAVSLLANRTAIAPGESVELAIEIGIPAPWHIYHPIILDTGFATTIEFEGPKGFRVDPPRFPEPTLEEAVELEYLEFSGKIVALATLHADADLPVPATATITATVSALACIEQCIPVDASAKLDLAIAAGGKPANEKLFADAAAAIPAEFATAAYLKGSQLAVKPAAVGLNERGELIATIRVEGKHHVQDRDPGVDSLIPTRLLVEPINGIDFAEESEQIWTKPHVRDMPGFGKVREQSGEFKIRVPFKVTDPEMPAGPIPVRLLLQYQCCSDAGLCYAPAWARAVATIDVRIENPARKDPLYTVVSDTWRAADSTADSAVQPLETPVTVTTPKQPDLGVTRPARAVPRLTADDWAESIPWQDWSPGWAEELAIAGHLVYVDYTASWCLTCQSNKQLVLETQTVRDKMRDLNVIPIKADFTRRSSAMFTEIMSHGRPGVPLNLVYAPGQPDRPGILPAVLTTGIVSQALDDPLAYADGGGQRSFVLILLFGFVGGLILNVMPCVLPVISIKVLSFVQQAGEDPRRVFRLGLTFCAGIMVWFWLFAALSATGNIPWQYPEVVIALSSFVFVFALNLFGVFEIMLPGAAVGKLDAFTTREGYVGTFFRGLLATLLGTACTAPFLGFALGYALTQPAWVGFVIFTAAGLGMASPYLLLSARPGWLKYLPKPGMWMITFKQAAGFVLMATALWLLWILASQLDAFGVVWTVAFWGFLALAVWMLGRIRPNWETGRRWTMWSASTLVVLVGFYFCFFFMYDLFAWRAGDLKNGAQTAETPSAIVTQR